MKTITITLKGGLIQDIEGIPKGVEVVVMDFDVEGVTLERIQTLEDGMKYIHSAWDSPKGASNLEVPRGILVEIQEWLTHDGFIDEVHFDEQSIISRIDEVLNALPKEE